VRKKFRDTINEWRAPPANERKQSLFLQQEKLNSPALPSQLLKLYRLITETDVALRQQCKCLTLAVLSIPRTTPATTTTTTTSRRTSDNDESVRSAAAAAAASTGGRRRSKKECVKSNSASCFFLTRSLTYLLK
jgi:hypothetical protein